MVVVVVVVVVVVDVVTVDVAVFEMDVVAVALGALLVLLFALVEVGVVVALDVVDAEGTTVLDDVGPREVEEGAGLGDTPVNGSVTFSQPRWSKMLGLTAYFTVENFTSISADQAIPCFRHVDPRVGSIKLLLLAK